MVKLEDAIILAANMHRDQVDKQGQPYILHTIRVMWAVPKELRHIAVLHDVLEDTEITEYDLKVIGFTDEDFIVLDALTRREGETYAQYIQRVKRNAGATTIKLADIDDNLKRIDGLSEPERDFLEHRYYRALAALKGE